MKERLIDAKHTHHHDHSDITLHYHKSKKSITIFRMTVQTALSARHHRARKLVLDKA